MAEINDLSVTDASNTARFPEAMAPSAVNDGARALEGILSRWHKDTNASIAAGGTGDAITVSANQTLSAYYDGLVIAFNATAANTTTATLNVDSVGAKKILKHFNTALVANDIKIGQKVIVIYDSDGDSSAGAWQMITHLGNAGLSSGDIGVSVQAYDADTLKADTTDSLTAGYSATSYSAGTKSTGTFTPDEANGNFQHYTNNGAHTLAPPTNTCTLIIDMTNDSSAGAVTTSGFTKVSGDSLTTTNGHKFRFFISKGNAGSHLQKQALQ